MSQFFKVTTSGLAKWGIAIAILAVYELYFRYPMGSSAKVITPVIEKTERKKSDDELTRELDLEISKTKKLESNKKLESV